MKLPEEVTISVERLIRYCYLAQMTVEETRRDPRLDANKNLPLHLTRFGVLTIETTSWLYSLFDNRNDSINLIRIWNTFENPFKDDLRSIYARLEPFYKGLQHVRNRLGFHGSLTRIQEAEGLWIFDIDSGNSVKLVRLIRDMQRLAYRMIEWYSKQPLPDGTRNTKRWTSFQAELFRIPIIKLNSPTLRAHSSKRKIKPK